MTWVLWIGAGVVALVALVALIGSILPKRHSASRRARLKASPEAVYAVIAGPPDWRTGIQNFGALPEQNGRKQWWEEDTHRHKIVFELVEDRPPSRIVTRITGQDLPFGGAWTFDISPTPDGGSEVRIREDGEVYNVIFRFLARFVFGYTATIEQYLTDLGAKFSQSVTIEV